VPAVGNGTTAVKLRRYIGPAPGAKENCKASMLGDVPVAGGADGAVEEVHLKEESISEEQGRTRLSSGRSRSFTLGLTKKKSLGFQKMKKSSSFTTELKDLGKLRRLSLDPRDVQQMLKVLLVIPPNVPRLTEIMAPLHVFSERCVVKSVSKEEKVTVGGLELGSDFTFRNAPRDFDVVIVLGGMKKSRIYDWIRSFRECPIIVRIKGGRVTLYRGSLENRKDTLLRSKTHIDASLDVLDVLYREHENSTVREPSSPSSMVSEGSNSSVGDEDENPGDQVAENLGFYRRTFGVGADDAEISMKLSMMDHLSLFARSFRRDRYVAVILSDDVNELGVATLIDIWSAARGVNLIVLADRESPSRREFGDVKSKNGVQFRGARALASFLRVPEAVHSLDAVILPPGSSFKPETVGRFFQGTIHDQRSLKSHEFISQQLSLLQKEIGKSAAKLAARKIVIEE